ncbi:MAG: hypothetical protein KJ846_01010, partial [Proteobacteria bacterium]|nr:hypothetical protein [Pseudomonadota bacterium]
MAGSKAPESLRIIPPLTAAPSQANCSITARSSAADCMSLISASPLRPLRHCRFSSKPSPNRPSLSLLPGYNGKRHPTRAVTVTSWFWQAPS